MLMRLGVLLLLLLTLQVLVPEGTLPAFHRRDMRHGFYKLRLQNNLDLAAGFSRGSTACLAFVQQDRKELLR
jgi:hypothetical protein